MQRWFLTPEYIEELSVTVEGERFNGGIDGVGKILDYRIPLLGE
ncbi:hypothetical protein N136_02625 [Leifsonia aquatica ATCC 14665]|uniref:Uncharacterized protein n=1 Tax=Leifsonia aquatica ATCC 14665 TaxID=1358026 RepID=U2RQD6_LEIAQ|nr:hypothetical protein N136_02625 [Leifsonia aquatica ATCC 14665]